MSTRNKTIGTVAIAVSCMVTGLAVAQATVPTVPYRLVKGSTFQQGCFGPCDCATTGPVELRGTFNLTRKSVGPLFTDYAVTGVAWQTVASNRTIKIAGSGTYRIGGEVAVTQQLQLDLVVDGQPVQHFDSGVVPGSNRFPIIEVSISVNGLQCYDTLIHVNAEPLLSPPATPYALDKRSTYRDGCGGPCLCVMGAPQPIVGTFLLTPMPTANVSLYRTYTVTQVNWKVLNASTSAPIHLTGSGTYRIGGDFALTHQLVLDLSTNGGTPLHYDSGTVVGGGAFPAINIQVSTDPMACFVAVIDLYARPLGDFDLDGTVSNLDLDHFQTCLSGPALAQADIGCQDADLDGDGSVDQTDFGIFQRCLTGDGGIATADCAE